MFYQNLNENEKYHPTTLKRKWTSPTDKGGKFHKWVQKKGRKRKRSGVAFRTSADVPCKRKNDLNSQNDKRVNKQCLIDTPSPHTAKG